MTVKDPLQLPEELEAHRMTLLNYVEFVWTSSNQERIGTRLGKKEMIIFVNPAVIRKRESKRRAGLQAQRVQHLYVQNVQKNCRKSATEVMEVTFMAVQGFQLADTQEIFE